MGETRGVYTVLVGKPEGKRPLGRLRRRWDDDIMIDLQEVGCSGFGGLEVACWPLVPQVREFKPGRSRRIISGRKKEKSSARLPFGGEVKACPVPCRRFAGM
jgi:hypothetical protein